MSCVPSRYGLTYDAGSEVLVLGAGGIGRAIARLLSAVGTRVTVAADDYGRDAVAGTILFGNAHEIAIARSDDEVGDVVVHFPRAGFMVTKV